METPFIEANALLAVQMYEEEDAREMLNQMLPNELADLGRAAGQLAVLVREVLSARGPDAVR